jgi:hypothetical protein
MFVCASKSPQPRAVAAAATLDPPVGVMVRPAPTENRKLCQMDFEAPDAAAGCLAATVVSGATLRHPFGTSLDWWRLCRDSNGWTKKISKVVATHT